MVIFAYADKFEGVVMAKQEDAIKKTDSGLEVQASYGTKDLPGDLHTGAPEAGEYPYTRGIHRDMYRGKLWTFRQYAGFGSAKEANERYKYLLKNGTTGLSVAFDLPTQMGRDSDHPIASGEVGRVGVAISTVEDMRELLEGIPLDKISLSMTINSTAGILLAFVMAVASERGVPFSALRGTIQNDVLKEFIARGTYIYPPRESLRLVTDIIKFCSAKVPEWNTISISGYHIREAGSTAPQEIGFTLANGIEYVEAALRAGLNVDDFAPRLAFFFNCQSDFLEEIAKFRAARKLWAKIMRERFKARESKSMMLRFHTQTAGSSLTAQQPLNNVVRTTIEAMAAVLGGTQSLHTNAYDEALCLPTEESATLALRTQQIIAYESGIAAAVDPLAGSYLIENWTDRLVQEAERVIEQVAARGGMVNAIEQGFPQQEIERSAYEFQMRIERKERIVVGVNMFQGESESGPPLQKPNPAAEKHQAERVKRFRAERNQSALAGALSRLGEAARRDGSVMEGIFECVKANGTLGEISDVLRGVWGEHR